MLKHATILVGALAILSLQAGGCATQPPASPAGSSESSLDSGAKLEPAEAPAPARSGTATAHPSEAVGPSRSEPKEAERQKPTEEPTEEPIEQPGEKPAERLAEESTEKPVEEPVASPEPADDSDEAVKALERKILAQWNKIQSLSAKTVTMEEAKQGDELIVTWEGGGTYDCKRSGDKTLVRMEVTNHAVVPPGMEVKDRVRKVSTVCDGYIVYTIREAMGMRQAAKLDADRGMAFEIGGPGVFEHLRDINTLQALPDGVVNDRPVYVIEGIPKAGDQKRVYYFDKQFGIMTKMVVEDQGRSRIRTLLLTEVNIDPQFSDDHFVFTLPPDVRMRDMTKAGREKAAREKAEWEAARAKAEQEEANEKAEQEGAGGDPPTTVAP